jgi:hypothetical protein
MFAGSPGATLPRQEPLTGKQEVQMLRMLGVLAIASGLAVAGSPVAQAQGMPMGTMKTTPQTSPKPNDRSDAATPTYGPNQAHLPAGTPERVTPTYRDTTEDRIMREKTDDGAHDSSDTQR